MTEAINELDVVSDANSDANSFLADVKSRVPDMYMRVYSIYRNRGLDAAKEFFAQYDPVAIKQKEKERKSAETKEKATAKIIDMRSLVLSKAELSDMIERIVLTEDYRKMCQRLNLPQLVSSNFVPKVSVSQRQMSVGLTIVTKNSYSPSLEGMKKFAADMKRNDLDSMLDDISKMKKEFSVDQKFIRQAKKGGYYYGDMDSDLYEVSRYVLIYNKFNMSYGVDRWGGVPSIHGLGYNSAIFSITGDEEEIFEVKSEYVSERSADMNKELVISVVERILVSLRNNLMKEFTKMRQHQGAMDIMNKGMENPGLNEGDLGDAKSDYYRKMDDWHRAKDKYEDDIWKEMFEYLLSLDMNRHEAWELIHTPEYTKQLKGKQAEWLKQNPEPKFTYDSGVQITKEQIIDILVTALEGGSNYWYLIKDVPKGVESDDMSLSEAIGEFILKGGEITIYDLEDEEEELGDLNMNKLLEAITIMKAEYPDMYQNLVNDEYDANDADIFFQIAVTGEVTFG